jgi:purine nucleoside permease
MQFRIFHECLLLQLAWRMNAPRNNPNSALATCDIDSHSLAAQHIRQIKQIKCPGDFMSKLIKRCVPLFLVLVIFLLHLSAQSTPPSKPIQIKVVVVAMFERGEDTGDTPGEYQLWVEREHLDQILPLPAGYHHVRLNKDGVLGILTGVGTAKAAASVMAVGLDPRFDLSKAYWLIAGIGGGDPADVSLGSAIWADHVLDGDLAYEIDARQIPENWPTGYVPLRKATPYEEPVRKELEGEIYSLNPQLVDWAFRLTKDTPLPDSDSLRTSRARFAVFPNALKSPFVTHGDTLSSSTFWHGSRMNEWANAWTRYYTGGKGNYMVAGMEDTGTMQALTFLSQAGRVDLQRVLVLRTVSNYDREPPGTNAADSLKTMVSGNYSAYFPALEAAQIVGDKVVRDIVEHWAARESTLPH